MGFQRTRAALARLVLPLAALAFAAAAHAQSVTLVAAGSLNLALSQVANTFTAETSVTVAQTYMPSGTLAKNRPSACIGDTHPTDVPCTCHTNSG